MITVEKKFGLSWKFWIGFESEELNVISDVRTDKTNVIHQSLDRAHKQYS